MLQFQILFHNAQIVYHVYPEKANDFVKISTFTNNLMVKCGISTESEHETGGTLMRASKTYSTGVQTKSRTSPVFSFFTTEQLATFTKDWYLSFLGPDLE